MEFWDLFCGWGKRRCAHLDLAWWPLTGGLALVVWDHSPAHVVQGGISPGIPCMNVFLLDPCPRSPPTHSRFSPFWAWSPVVLHVRCSYLLVLPNLVSSVFNAWHECHSFCNILLDPFNQRLLLSLLNLYKWSGICNSKWDVLGHFFPSSAENFFYVHFWGSRYMLKGGPCSSKDPKPPFQEG